MYVYVCVLILLIISSSVHVYDFFTQYTVLYIATLQHIRTLWRKYLMGGNFRQFFPTIYRELSSFINILPVINLGFMNLSVKYLRFTVL